MTPEQLQELINRLEIQNAYLVDIIQQQEQTNNMLTTQLNNLSSGIHFIMIGVALLIAWFVIKLLWGLFANWFFGGV